MRVLIFISISTRISLMTFVGHLKANGLKHPNSVKNI